jgi:S1-C subfamily serine protease
VRSDRAVAATWFAVLLVGALAAGPRSARAQRDVGDEPRSATTTVFARYASRILKIQTVEVGSSAKVSTGTGFFVTADGRMMTNYHVISEWIHEPENHRIEVLGVDDAPIVARVLAIDVVSDLAILETGQRTLEHFTLSSVSLLQGERLYSLGHPGDLGLSIVEGTYNGFLQHTLYTKIHFTGSINPGMSGGPTITERGRVVGVNVSTMGNQRSFLVPQERAAALLARVQTVGYAPPDSFLPVVATQIHAFQNEYLDAMFDGEVATVAVGGFNVPTEPKPIFRCWGNADREPEDLVETLEHWCSTDDDVYIGRQQSAGVISIHHEVLRATGVGTRRFTSEFSTLFGRDNTPRGSEKHVTVWRCTTRSLRTDDATLRVAYCLRRFKKLPGLYDAVVKLAALGSGSTGLVSTLTLTGVSAENAERLSARWLELVSWR